MILSEFLRKKIIIGLFGCILLCTTLPTVSFASSTCPIIEPIQVGSTTTSNRFYAKTTEDATGGWVKGSGKWLLFHPDNRDAMLATLLTAISLNRKIQICSTDESYESSVEIIKAIYLLQ